MKTTVTANVGGIAFHIDEDAYTLLRTYLTEIENHLHANDSKAEIMQDIEARIAELFKQHLNFSHLEVVSLSMVQDVTEQLGRPEVISDGFDESTDETASDTQETDAEEIPNESKKTVNKRFYRDTDHQVISGLCAGLGKMAGIDPIWFRLIFIFLTFCNGVGLLAYLIMWVVVQPANTAARRLEMQGIEPSAENIKAEVERQREYQETHPYKPGRSTAGTLAYGCLITLAILIGLPILFALFIMLIVFGALVIGVGSIPFAGMFGISDAMISSGVLTGICGLLTVLLPIIAIIIWLVRRNRNGKRLHPAFWIITLILWLISIAGLAVSGVKSSLMLNDIDTDKVQEQFENWAKDAEEHAEAIEAWADSVEQQAESFQQRMDSISNTGVLEVTDETPDETAETTPQKPHHKKKH